MPKVDFIFFDAGGGHRAAATALDAVIRQQGRAWDVRLVNLQDLLDRLDIFRKYTGIRMQDVYNRMLERGWTLGSEYLVPPMHWLIRLYHGQQVRMLTEFWRESPPDLVVSVVPNFNRALLQGLRGVSDRTPFVTVLTDLADYPPHFWIERQQQYLICGTDKAVAQARELGHAAERIFRVSGMILRPMFYEPVSLDRPAELRRLGLTPDIPTALVLFGGYGSTKMLGIAERLAPLRGKLQLIMICGRNEKLAAQLQRIQGGPGMHIVGFTQDIPRYMAISDFFIGKPGPGSISEALAMHLPVIVEKNAWTLPQERYNADWVRENGLGIVLEDFRDIGGAVRDLLEPGVFAKYHAAAGAIVNRAVFEIPNILERLLAGSERH